MPVRFKGAHCPPESRRLGGRGEVAYPMRERPVEERLEARGGVVDHATVQSGVGTYSPPVVAACPRRKRPVGRSWRLDETYSRGTGAWRYRSRAVDTPGQTLDVLLTERWEQAA